MGEFLSETFNEDWLKGVQQGTFVILIDSLELDTDLFVLTNGDNAEASYLMSRANIQMIVGDSYGEGIGSED
jgi:hypothetical protein